MNFLVLSALFLLGALTLATAEPRPHVMRSMSADEIFGLTKRQGGYHPPPPVYCPGEGTCAQACGAGYISCGSGNLCYNPPGDVCCSSINRKHFPFTNIEGLEEPETDLLIPHNQRSA